MLLECGKEIWYHITKVMGMPYGEELMITDRTMWAQSTAVADGQINDDEDCTMHSVVR